MQIIDRRTLESKANTYFENLTPQQSSGWAYTGECYFDIDKDIVIGYFEVRWGGEILPRTKVIDPKQFMED